MHPAFQLLPRRVLPFMLCVFLHAEIIAQVTIKSISLQPTEEWISYSFPLVMHKEDSIAGKINLLLQGRILFNEEIELDSNSIFTASRYLQTDSSFQGGYTQIDYNVEVNTSLLFSLFFQLESTGAYSESYPAYFNFNLQNGDPIYARDLFTPTGITSISNLLLKERKTRIKDWLKEIRNEYEPDDSAWVMQSFEECNREPGTNNFLIRPNGILFYKEYCFPHAARPFDTDLDIFLSHENLVNYLSENGRKLLGVKSRKK